MPVPNTPRHYILFTVIKISSECDKIMDKYHYYSDKDTCSNDYEKEFEYDITCEAERIQQEICLQWEYVSNDPRVESLDDLGIKRPYELTDSYSHYRRRNLYASDPKEVNFGLPQSTPSPSSLPPGTQRIITIRKPIFSTNIPEFRIKSCTGEIEYWCGVKCTVSTRGSRCRNKYCTRRVTYPCALQKRTSRFTIYIVITMPNPNSLENRVRDALMNCYNNALRDAEIVAAATFAASSASVGAAILAALQAGVEEFYDSFTDCLINAPEEILNDFVDDFDVHADYKITKLTPYKDIKTYPIPGR